MGEWNGWSKDEACQVVGWAPPTILSYQAYGENAMSNGSTVRFVAVLVPTLLVSASLARGGDDKRATGTQKRYPSPKAVFDAYREADGRRDWRQCFSLMTEDWQSDRLFECVFTLSESAGKESLQVLKKYRLDEATFDADLKAEYKAKHGAEPDDTALMTDLEKEYKARHRIGTARSGAAQSGAEPQPPLSATPRDITRDIMRDLLAMRVKDKAGFYSDTLEAISGWVSVSFGDLEQVAVRGDMATGRVKISMVFHHDKMSNRHSISPVNFKMVNGSWLIDFL
jgi:hypothetical protein